MILIVLICPIFIAQSCWPYKREALCWAMSGKLFQLRGSRCQEVLYEKDFSPQSLPQCGVRERESREKLSTYWRMQSIFGRTCFDNLASLGVTPSLNPKFYNGWGNLHKSIFMMRLWDPDWRVLWRPESVLLIWVAVFASEWQGISVDQ